MKTIKIKFIKNHTCENTAFWLTRAGSIAHKYHPELLACVVATGVNADIIKQMILCSELDASLYTAEHLNETFSIC